MFGGFAGAVLKKIESARPANEIKMFKKSIDDFEKEESARLKSDTFGGISPEETWRMFMAALQSESTEQAMKYFWGTSLKEINSNPEFFAGQLKNFQMPANAKIYPQTFHSPELQNPELQNKDFIAESQDRRYYEFFIPAVVNGENLEMARPVVFRFNKINKIWKIETL